MERPHHNGRADALAENEQVIVRVALDKDIMDHLAMYVGQSPVDTIVIRREPFVIETQQVENCRM